LLSSPTLLVFFLAYQCSIIFNTLVDSWMNKHSYPQPISKLTRPLVAATIEVGLDH
jgi:hypothetical protein